MSNINKCIVSRDSGRLQIPYQDYVALMERVNQGQHLRQVKENVIANLQSLLSKKYSVAEVDEKVQRAIAPSASAPAAEPAAAAPVAEPAAADPVSPVEKEVVNEERAEESDVMVPPIKKNISAHFNSLDESGRLFSVFKQYYACLNDSCGGTVCVTMKDGFCSLWNYDEWEEFAFIDIFEGQLRIAVDPRYTNALQSLNLCEVPRLLSSRRNLVCVQVDGLNKTILEVLAKAFEEVGVAIS